jgi:hypothetical protein
MRDIGVDAALKQVLTLASAEVGDQ